MVRQLLDSTVGNTPGGRISQDRREFVWLILYESGIGIGKNMWIGYNFEGHVVACDIGHVRLAGSRILDVVL